MTVGKAACALAMSATKTARKVVVRNMSAKVRAEGAEGAFVRRAQWWSPSPIQKTCLRSTRAETIFAKRKHVGDADCGLTSAPRLFATMADQRFSEPEPDFGTRLESFAQL